MQRVKIYRTSCFLAENVFPHRPMVGDELTIGLIVYKVVATRWESNATAAFKIDDHWKVLVIQVNDLTRWPNEANHIHS